MRTERLLLLATLSIATLGSTAAFAQDQNAITDAQLQKDVSQALHNDTQLGSIAILATASQGAVTLKGTVATEQMRTEAEQAVAGVSGVRSIQDNLTVTTQAAPAAAANEAPPPPDEPEPAQTSAQTSAQTAASIPPPPPADTPQSGTPQSGTQAGTFTPFPGGGSASAQPDWGTRGNAHVPQGFESAPRQAAPGLASGSASGAAPVEQQTVSGPVTLAAGTLLNVRTSEPISTGHAKDGEFFSATAAGDVYAGGVLAIPRGASLTGQVIEAKNAGALGGSPKLELVLTGMQLGEDSYELASDTWSSQGPSKTGYTAANTIGGAAVGALIGAVAGGGIGAGIGAVAGGASGALISGATHGPRLDLPPEALLQFHLEAPLTVQPVPFAEAARLAASAPTPAQPVLRVRPAYVAAPYPYAVPYGYYARPYPYYVRANPYGYYGRY